MEADSKRRNTLKPITSWSFTGKCLGLPCAAALFFIVFTIFYSPDVYKRSISVLPYALGRVTIIGDEAFKPNGNMTDLASVNPIILRSFLPEVIHLIRMCNRISSMVVLEPTAVQCLHDQSCLMKPPPPSYRFGIIAEGQAEPGTLLSKMVSDSMTLDWNASIVSVPARAIVLEKGEILVIVSVLEVRPNYWYVHGTTSNDPVKEVARAFVGLNLTERDIGSDDGNKLLVPTPADFFSWQWPRSPFLECNRTSAAYLRKKYPDNYATVPKIDDSFLEILAYTRDLMLKYRMTPMLSGGTGLGWYRECGIIPDTTDMDLMFPAIEWKPDFERELKKNKVVQLYWILGKPDDSLELSVCARGIKIDLFALYEESNQSWVGGMMVTEKRKLRWWYPKFGPVCTADLKGHLFYARCDIVDFLKADYGPGWYEPHHNANFVWYKSHKNIQRNGKWSQKEWPSVYRTFSYGC